MKIQVRDDKVIIDGYVNAVERFSKPLTNKNGKKFIERIMPSVFQRAIEKNDAIKVLLNHNYDMELANTKDGSAKLYEDNIGLRAIVEVSDATVIEKAKQNNILAAAFTFDRIPLSICPQRQQHFITTNSERRAFMESLGINALIEYPFTEKLMNTDAGEFIEDIIIRKLRAKVVVVGTDYHFGKGRSGDADMLVKCGPEYGFETIVVEKEKYQDKEISSTYVREELVLGHMETVNVLMGRPYSIEGIVCPGNQFGRKIKIPTMNIYPQESKLLPPNGVYASITQIDGKEYGGVTNIGTKPTVSTDQVIGVETNLFDYEEDAYGKHIKVKLLHFIRPEMKFESIEALSKQMESDAQFSKSMLML